MVQKLKILKLCFVKCACYDFIHHRFLLLELALLIVRLRHLFNLINIVIQRLFHVA